LRRAVKATVVFRLLEFAQEKGACSGVKVPPTATKQKQPKTKRKQAQKSPMTDVDQLIGELHMDGEIIVSLLSTL
jgi:hypothetical protein